MQLNPHLTFGGQCEAAFTFYEKCLGGKIVLLMMYGDSPLAEQTPLAGRKKIIHAKLALGDHRLTDADLLRRANKPCYTDPLPGTPRAPRAGV